MRTGNPYYATFTTQEEAQALAEEAQRLEPGSQFEAHIHDYKPDVWGVVRKVRHDDRWMYDGFINWERTSS